MYKQLGIGSKVSLSEKHAPSYLSPIAQPDRLIEWCLGLLWVMNGFEELVKALGFPLEPCFLEDPRDSAVVSTAPSEGSLGLLRAVVSNGTFQVDTVQYRSHQPQEAVSPWDVTGAAKSLNFKSYTILINFFNQPQVVVQLLSHVRLFDGQQHIKLSCPSLSPRACSNSCSLSQ